MSVSSDRRWDRVDSVSVCDTLGPELHSFIPVSLASAFSRLYDSPRIDSHHIIALVLPAPAHPDRRLPSGRLHVSQTSLVDVVTRGRAGDEFQDCFPFMAPWFSRLFELISPRARSSPTVQLLSARGLNEEFTTGAPGNLHTIVHYGCG
ncbi:unnamed protein product [Pleuronectes platessa]|uniref:Uncharacterized protein n=1 Tax=Pleuronectes platessa TaxID=8262 RepID=A0A9N7TP38_PLEPL|nr:unnamed protein product [Pleuronectes platessa]